MGAILTNPKDTPTSVVDDWQTLVARDAVSYYGKNKVSLTNWDSLTLAPEVAQGSVIDIDGSIATFIADESIGGSPSDGAIWLKFVVSGSTVTAEWTGTAPTWYADKSGWYNASGERYSGHSCTLASSAYSLKNVLTDPQSPGKYATGFKYIVGASFTEAEVVQSVFYGTTGSSGSKQWFSFPILEADILGINVIVESQYGVTYNWFSDGWGDAYVEDVSATLTINTTNSDFNSRPVRVLVTHIK